MGSSLFRLTHWQRTAIVRTLLARKASNGQNTDHPERQELPDRIF
jgi:hypothetical protein